MNKICLLAILIMFQCSLVYADTIVTSPVNITVYNNTLEIKGAFTNSYVNLSVSIINNSLQQQSFTFNDYYIDNKTQLVNLDAMVDLLKCQNLIGITNTSLSNCLSDLIIYQNQSTGFLQCQLNLKDKDLEISNQLKNYNDCKNNTSNTSNQGWLWGIGGIALASLFWKRDTIFGLAKNKAMGEFNPSQRG